MPHSFGGASVEAWRESRRVSRLSKRRMKAITKTNLHDNSAPFHGPKTLPQKYLVSEEIFAEEQKRIFSKQWVCVGHQSEIATAGDYLLAQIAGESVLIVRDQFGEVRAFYNICRHRGTR